MRIRLQQKYDKPLLLLSIVEFLIFRLTEPGKIQITFQCNNVDEESASANVDLGELNYEENINTKLLCDNEVIKIKN